MKFKLVFLLLLCQLILSGQSLQIIEKVCPVSENSFRGLSALSENEVWLSSNQGQVWFYSAEKGWEDRSPRNYESTQWRDIEAFNDSTAIILSAGSPALVLRTDDGGKQWTETYRDEDPDIFFDAMDFWDESRGVAFADAQGDYLSMIETLDGGRSWSLKDSSNSLLVWPNQGGFAASGTCLHTYKDSSWFIVLGGKQAIMVYDDPGKLLGHTLPLDSGAASKGAFSIDFKNRDTIIVVGGDYRADSLTKNSVTVSYNGGFDWIKPDFPSELNERYWSCVQWQRNRIILCSRFGTAISLDNGKNWEVLKQGFYSTDGIWFSGPQGRLGRLSIP